MFTSVWELAAARVSAELGRGPRDPVIVLWLPQGPWCLSSERSRHLSTTMTPNLVASGKI